MLQQPAYTGQLLGGLRFVTEVQAELLEPQKVLAKLRGCALGGRARIVQFVHQAGRECPQRDKLLPVQRLHLVRLQALGHVGEHRGAERRTAGHQVPERLDGKPQNNSVAPGRDTKAGEALACQQCCFAKSFSRRRNSYQGARPIALWPFSLGFAIENDIVVSEGLIRLDEHRTRSNLDALHERIGGCKRG